MQRIVLVLLILLTASLTSAQSSFESTECPMFVPENVQVDCGFLTVPEDRDVPDGNTIRLAVAIVRSDNPNPQPDPIVYLEGGPGGSALLALDAWFDTPLRNERDIVLIDQRGTGYSEPALVCGYDDTSDQAAEFAWTCANDLVTQGINLTAYTSKENAADIADLRQALGYEAVNLYGVSYGTRLALTVMRDHPQGIRSVVLDSVYPPQVAGLDEQAPNAYAAFSALFAACASDADCNSAFPDLEARFYTLLDESYANSIDVNGEAYSDYDIILQLFDSMYDTYVIPYLPAIIDGLADGDSTLFSQLIDGSLWAEDDWDDYYGYYDYGDDYDYYSDDYDGYGYGYMGGTQALLGLFDGLYMEYLGYDNFDDYIIALESTELEDFITEVIPFLEDEISDADFAELMMMFLELESPDDALAYVESLPVEDYNMVLLNFATLIYTGGDGYYGDYYGYYDDYYGEEYVSEDADGMFNSVECYEEAPFNSLENAQQLAQGLPQRIAEAFLQDIELFLETCAVWQVDAPDPIETQAVSSDIPTLILSGEFDPITPPAWGDVAAQTLSRSYVFTYPGAGHAVIDAGDCALEIVNDFLNKPDNAPDASCLNDVEVEFITQP